MYVACTHNRIVVVVLPLAAALPSRSNSRPLLHWRAGAGRRRGAIEPLFIGGGRPEGQRRCANSSKNEEEPKILTERHDDFISQFESRRKDSDETTQAISDTTAIEIEHRSAGTGFL